MYIHEERSKGELIDYFDCWRFTTRPTIGVTQTLRSSAFSPQRETGSISRHCIQYLVLTHALASILYNYEEPPQETSNIYDDVSPWSRTANNHGASFFNIAGF